MAILFSVFLFTLISSSFAQYDPHYLPGRTTMVHLFEWRWNDIADECERFLGPYNFAGVQVSPASENAVIANRPWYERYQPVSYNLNTTRSGDEEEFKSMVRRCNAVGVRIFVDIVMNQMADGSGVGTGGCPYDSGRKEYPCIHYSYLDFNPTASTNCPSPHGNVTNYDNEEEVRNCALLHMNDLNQGNVYVQGKVAEYMSKLVGFGVAGFRIDAAKHMWPGDLEIILGMVSNLSVEHGFAPGSRPFYFHEVIESATEPIKGSHYFSSGRVTEFNYGKYLGNMIRGNDKMKELDHWGENGWGLFRRDRALVFIDNHDNQRGHGGGGDVVVTFKQSRMYKMVVAFMLAHPYGLTRLMSSFDFDDNNQGPPNQNGETLPVPINPDLTCGNGWICEHRWRQIYNMVDFRNIADGTDINDFQHWNDNRIAFCRGDRAFIAINNDNVPLDSMAQTCLQPGLYCDVISGTKEDCKLNVTVGANGLAHIYITDATEDPMIAIHVGPQSKW